MGLCLCIYEVTLEIEEVLTQLMLYLLHKTHLDLSLSQRNGCPIENSATDKLPKNWEKIVHGSNKGNIFANIKLVKLCQRFNFYFFLSDQEFSPFSLTPQYIHHSQ